MARTTRQRYLARHRALLDERSSWDSHWRELGEYVLPRRTRFSTSERNVGRKKHAAIINSTATRAARTLAAGMMAGITSPARPWFRLAVPDAVAMKSTRVREWLDEVTEVMRAALSRSNIYNSLHSVYLDMGGFGTTALLVEEDKVDGLRGYCLPVGSYSLANSDRMAVDTLYREVSFTAAQLAEKFGEKAVSPRVREMLKRGQLDTWVRVLHVVEPNTNFEEGKLGPRGKPFRSCWLEMEADEQHKGILREAGFNAFPVMAPRWDVCGEDVYGSSPGMDALGDVKALQVLERRAAEAAAKIISPPMRAGAALMNQKLSLLPGDVTFGDVISGGQKFEPALDVHPSTIQVLELKIREHERRVNGAFYADLWLMMASNDNPQQTAREVAERHEEKMLQLGPVLERLQDELLDPLIDRVFGILERQGQLPPAPDEIADMPMKVEYVSIMAQAQRMLGTSAIERLASFVGNLAAVQPTVLDKVNVDAAVEAYAEMLGTPARILVDDEEVKAKRGAREEAARAQQAAESVSTVAQGAKTLSEADMGGDSALARLVGSLGGAAAATARGV